MVNCDKKKDSCRLRIWVEGVINRDKKCVKCGSTHDLTAHHVRRLRYGDKEYFSVDSGVCLCRKCHDEFHRGVGSYYFSREVTLKFVMGVKDWCYVG